MSDNQVDADPATGPQTSPETPSVAFDFNSIARSSLIDAMGIVFVEASPELVIGTMPVEGNTQPMGLLHGGASCVLAETLASTGAALHGARIGKYAVGIDINATHHRGASSGLVTATARPLQLGGSLASYEIVIVDDADRRVCTARLTCLLRPIPENWTGQVRREP
ncbi:MAG TPA: hotdog fold thioesterase [Kineosporiaceae bacterium]|nr:hotdog fold thioesterase [Kineosporiaceae bacterium]